jgi:hypothetical protein
MLKKSVQQGRSERRGEAYSLPYVEPLREARTPLAGFFSILLVESYMGPQLVVVECRTADAPDSRVVALHVCNQGSDLLATGC